MNNLDLRKYSRCDDGFRRLKMTVVDDNGQDKDIFIVRWPDGGLHREQPQSEHVCPGCCQKETK